MPPYYEDCGQAACTACMLGEDNLLSSFSLLTLYSMSSGQSLYCPLLPRRASLLLSNEHKLLLCCLISHNPLKTPDHTLAIWCRCKFMQLLTAHQHYLFKGGQVSSRQNRWTFTVTGNSNWAWPSFRKTCSFSSFSSSQVSILFEAIVRLWCNISMIVRLHSIVAKVFDLMQNNVPTQPNPPTPAPHYEYTENAPQTIETPDSIIFWALGSSYIKLWEPRINSFSSAVLPNTLLENQLAAQLQLYLPMKLLNYNFSPLDSHVVNNMVISMIWLIWLLIYIHIICVEVNAGFKS